MTIQDILNNSRVGDIVCDRILSEHDIATFRAISAALYKAHTIRGLKWALRDNVDAIEWINCLSREVRR